MISLLFVIFLTPMWAQVQGVDTREFAKQSKSTAASSSLIVISNLSSVNKGRGEFRIGTARAGDFYSLCKGERFYDSFIAHGANCAATMIAPNIAVTASHCMQRNEFGNVTCDSRYFVAGIDQDNLRGVHNTRRQLATCQVLASGISMYDDSPSTDWTLLELRSVEGAALPDDFAASPVPLAKPGLPKVGDKVHTFGHPQRLAGVKSRGKVNYVGSGKTGVRTDMSINGGNSGGGVFNEKGELMGLAITSYQAYRPYSFEPSGCARWAKMDDIQEKTFLVNDHERWVTGSGVLPIEYFREDIDWAIENFRRDVEPPTAYPGQPVNY